MVIKACLPKHGPLGALNDDAQCRLTDMKVGSLFVI